MSEFLAMGGYAWYVWMAYGAAVVAVAVEIAAVHARRKRAFELARMSVEPLPQSTVIHDAQSNG